MKIYRGDSEGGESTAAAERETSSSEMERLRGGREEKRETPVEEEEEERESSGESRLRISTAKQKDQSLSDLLLRLQEQLRLVTSKSRLSVVDLGGIGLLRWNNAPCSAVCHSWRRVLKGSNEIGLEVLTCPSGGEGRGGEGREGRE
ncbi:unnamed protein product [Pleuronectes platessa]|uniref:Uncharacterized protein n=1 Tax=Pleuronectes platessa TaxID=8262 RepID=A0A9N7VJV8_PLEPL|nr:unnamed protein product [Pleuronectes platessa]